VDFHDVKTRLGNTVFAELHLSFKGDTTVETAHNLAHHLEEDVTNELPEVILTIQIDSSV
jgi:divalent metal cation (Fe/Co/Zn/Cd) transporter